MSHEVLENGVEREFARAADFIARSRQRGQRAYAVIDACDEPAVPPRMFALGPSLAVSLYRGRAERDYWSIAPYLAFVDDDLAHWLHEHLTGRPWGFLVSTEMDLSSLRRHLRRLLLVEVPDGRTMLFRFYDPRVLHRWLASATPDEVGELLAPGLVAAVPTESGEVVVYGQASRSLAGQFEVVHAR
jgi:hypothetical protein